MTRCLTEADIHRLLDTPASDRWRAQAETHLESCGRCRAMFDELAAQSARVDRWLQQLAEQDRYPSIEVAWARMQARVGSQAQARQSGWQWAVALAAVVIAIVVTESEAPKWTAANQAAVAPRGAAGRADESAFADFVSLDAGSPMQMGLIVRVTVPAATLARYGVDVAGDVQADVLVGDDGIAHAFRVVR